MSLSSSKSSRLTPVKTWIKPTTKNLFLILLITLAFVTLFSSSSQTNCQHTVNKNSNVNNTNNAYNREREEHRELIAKQDATIKSLMEQLEISLRRHINHGISSDESKQNQAIDNARREISDLEYQVKLKNTLELKPASSDFPNTPTPMTTTQKACESRFGHGLISSWMSNPTDVCTSSDSKITCYTHQHSFRPEHFSFCVISNAVVDFSKVIGRHSNVGNVGRKKGEYHTFASGALTSSCVKNEAFRSISFSNHAKGFMEAFIAGAGEELEYDEEVSQTMYLYTRDEDSDNMFHTSADFINMHIVYSGLDLYSDKNANVMLFDRHDDGPYIDLVKNTFSNGVRPSRAEDFSGKKVKFKKLVLHLESPASIVSPAVAGQGAQVCKDSSLYDTFRHRVLSAFGLWDVPPPGTVSILFVVRRRTGVKNTGRVFENEQELIDLTKARCALCTVTVVDLAVLPFADQISLVRNSNIIIGVHGAGLNHIFYAAEESVLIEIHPHYRLDRHFRNAARMTPGKYYMPIRSMTPVKCKGSSDAIYVSPSEYKSALDGAIRLARSFDDGLSECGGECDMRILALDEGNDGEYEKFGLTKVARPSTKFPCH